MRWRFSVIGVADARTFDDGAPNSHKSPNERSIIASNRVAHARAIVRRPDEFTTANCDSFAIARTVAAPDDPCSDTVSVSDPGTIDGRNHNLRTVAECGERERHDGTNRDQHHFSNPARHPLWPHDTRQWNRLPARHAQRRREHAPLLCR